MAKKTKAEKEAARAAKKAARKAQPEIKIVPEFYDAEGQLMTLKQGNFPRSKIGRLAYCDYQIEKWKIKKLTVEARMDPLAKKRKKREKLMDQLKKLEEELQAEEKNEQEASK